MSLVSSIFISYGSKESSQSFIHAGARPNSLWIIVSAAFLGIPAASAKARKSLRRIWVFFPFTRGSLGVGLGLAAIMYFLNIISNLADSVSFLKYVTPFGYCEGGDIVNDGLDAVKIIIGLTFGALGIAAAYGKYTRKDIRA